jgi:integrase
METNRQPERDAVAGQGGAVDLHQLPAEHHPRGRPHRPRPAGRLGRADAGRAVCGSGGWRARPVDSAAAPHPAPPGARRVLTTWTATQLRAFLAGVAEDRLAALWQLAVASGMRIGELAALEWPDVHLDGQYLTVRRSKTATGRRRAELDPATIAVLRAHRRRQAAERLAFGVGYRDHGRVFTRPGGEPLNPDAVSIQFKRRAARLGLPLIRFHDLRHGWATMALEAGEHPKVVAEQLGHASVRVTLDTYSHVTPGVQRDAVARVASRFLDPAVSSLLANGPASATGVTEAGP